MWENIFWLENFNVIDLLFEKLRKKILMKFHITEQKSVSTAYEHSRVHDLEYILSFFNFVLKKPLEPLAKRSSPLKF